MSNEKFRPGQIVIWSDGARWSSRSLWGRVTRVTAKGTVFVREAREGAEEIRAPRWLRVASKEEIAQRVWAVNRPRGMLASVYMGLGGRTEPQRVHMSDEITSPVLARQAAAELIAIAEWWEANPSDKPANESNKPADETLDEDA
jgi:hypothetical protein